MSDPNSIDRMQEFVGTIEDAEFLDCYGRAIRETTHLPPEFRAAAKVAISARKIELMRAQQRGRR